MDDADRILKLYKIMIYYSIGLRYYCASAAQISRLAPNVGVAIPEFYEDHVQCYREPRIALLRLALRARFKYELLAQDDTEEGLKKT